MEKYKAIIVDDDPISQKIVAQCLNRSGEFEEPKFLADALGLKVELQNHVYDVVFLDVELPEISGLEFVKAFETLPQIVLMSNMKHYAVDAFEVEVLDFLPKPIEYSRFLKTLNKLDKSLQGSNNVSKTHNDIFLKVNGKLQKIDLNEVLFFESMSDYVKIITSSKTYVILQTMNKLQDLLPDNFLRCHRSYMVNISKVNAMDDRVLEIDTHAVPVSRSYYNEIKGRFKVLG